MTETRRRWTLKEQGDLIQNLEALALFFKQTAVKLDQGKDVKGILRTFEKKLEEREAILEELVKLLDNKLDK